MHEAGGVYMAMKTLLDGGFIDPNPITVTGKTIGENLEEITWNPDQKVFYDVKTPITPTGGVVGLKGSLAPDGAIVKVAGMARCNSPARRGCSIARKMPSPPSNSATLPKAA
jgi:dihydroxy-acid dehydratase